MTRMKAFGLISVMGCFHSKISPGHDKAKAKKENGEESPGIKERKVLRSDVAQRYEARKLREDKLRQRQRRIVSAAEELSSKVLEERETLSINSKSRATSRNTSRAGSPSLQKKQVTFNTIYSTTPRTEMSKLSETADGAAESDHDTESGNPHTHTNGNAVSVT